MKQHLLKKWWRPFFVLVALLGSITLLSTPDPLAVERNIEGMTGNGQRSHGTGGTGGAVSTGGAGGTRGAGGAVSTIGYEAYLAQAEADQMHLRQFTEQFAKDHTAFLADPANAAKKTKLQQTESSIKKVLADLHETVMGKLYPKGLEYNEATLAIDIPKVATLVQPIVGKYEHNKLKQQHAASQYEVAHTQTKAYRARDYFYALLALITAIMVVHSLTNDDPNKLEYVILAMAVLVLVTQVYAQVADLVSDAFNTGLAKLSRLIGDAFYS
jgi:hypothetical protein